MGPLVSILIPCYNAERWIAQAIESALDQTWESKEVIVVDDGSSDSSLDIIRKFDGKIQWETGRNQGGGVARNRLLELSRGDWLQYLDADDYLLPEKIRQQMVFLAERGDTDVLFGPATLEYYSESEARRELLPIPEPHDPWVLLASWGLPQTGAPLWRKKAILDVGGWKRDQPCCQEHELYLRLLSGGARFTYCPTNGAIYRQWSEGTVCKRDVGEVHRRRLEIERLAETYLREQDELTTHRLQAINQARFEIARSAWKYSPGFAKAIMTDVHSVDPNFSPVGAAAPLRYRLIYHSLGFTTAEVLAGWLRGASDISSLVRMTKSDHT